MPVNTEEEFHLYDDDVPENIHCPYCLKRGYQVKLGGKVLMPGEVRPDDYENYLACTVCYAEIPIYQVEPDASIKDVVETIENPFDHTQGQVVSVPNRATQMQRRKKKALITRGVTKPRSRRFKQDEKIDPDIANERGTVNILYDSK